jgi:glycosyltransferase involved in cell wall biosynthesis
MKKNIQVIPNMNDLKDFDFPKKKSEKFIIGYPGSNSHHDDLQLIAPALGNLMKKYKHLHLEIVGAVDKQQLYLFKEFDLESLERCNFISGTWTFKEYPELIANSGWTIGIAPLVDSAFTRSKSHIKWMEFSCFKIPVIASRVYPYFMESFKREVIEDDKTGLLVKPKEWENALESLILNESKRKELGENAYNAIKDRWQYGEDFSKRMDEVINSMY